MECCKFCVSNILSVVCGQLSVVREFSVKCYLNEIIKKMYRNFANNQNRSMDSGCGYIRHIKVFSCKIMVCNHHKTEKNGRRSSISQNLNLYISHYAWSPLMENVFAILQQVFQRSIFIEVLLV